MLPFVVSTKEREMGGCCCSINVFSKIYLSIRLFKTTRLLYSAGLCIQANLPKRFLSVVVFLNSHLILAVKNFLLVGCQQPCYPGIHQFYAAAATQRQFIVLNLKRKSPDFFLFKLKPRRGMAPGGIWLKFPSKVRQGRPSN